MSPNRLIRSATFALLSSVSLVASAFMPAAGAWNIVAESTTNAAGRGMTIEVENDILLVEEFKKIRFLPIPAHPWMPGKGFVKYPKSDRDNKAKW